MTNRSKQRVGMLLLLTLAALLWTGCNWNVETARKVARVTNWPSTTGVQVRRRPRNQLARPLSWWTTVTGHGGIQPDDRTRLFLRTHALEEDYWENPESVLSELRSFTIANPDHERLHVLATLAYIEGHRSRLAGNERYAGQMLATAVAASYQFLFDPRLDQFRNAYDPVFRQMCDTYNKSLEGLLRIMRAQNALRPGGRFTASMLDGKPLHVDVEMTGRWQNQEFDRFEFVTDYDAEGLKNIHRTWGLGVPLIGVRKRGENTGRLDEQYYPSGLSLPLTAFVTTGIVESNTDTLAGSSFRIQLLDPLEKTDVRIVDRDVPLESDITTPLAFFLDDPLLDADWFATAALLNGDFAHQFGGLYMLEPYDPAKIPVVMVHGFWSSPMTWTEMFNDLRADPAIRDNYQFWFYLYPSGQPFWFSARQMRDDLADVRSTLDPDSSSLALNEMVLVGHSMGGLVSRLQTITSENDFWELVSDRDYNQLKGDAETRRRVRDTLHFEANPSIARVITIGTPLRGSPVSNTLTRWLSQRLFTLPGNLTSDYHKIMLENPDFFKSDLLKISTSTDSLSPESRFFEVMMQAENAPRIRYHNIIGVYRARSFAKLIDGSSELSDGVVSLASATASDAVSEIQVAAEHSSVHQHPRSVLEVKRILYEHLNEVFEISRTGQSIQKQNTVAPAAYITSDKDPRVQEQ